MMKTDLRIVKTETAIEGAFLELIEMKGYENVHLLDIAKRANVNRNTIYLRYGTKEDIVKKIIDKAFKKQLEELNTESLIKTRSNRRAVSDMFTSIFNVLSKDIEIYRIILTDFNLSGYTTYILNTIRSMIFVRVAETPKNRLIVEYVLRGAFGVIQNWIIYDTGSIEDNVKILTSLLVPNVHHLTYK